MNFCSYHRPTSLTELYLLLERERNTPLFLSGGTDILVQDRANGKYVGRAVYDLTALPELKEIRRNDDTLLIGGEVTHSAVANSPLVCQLAGPLAAACGMVGAVQLRNLSLIHI